MTRIGLLFVATFCANILAESSVVNLSSTEVIPQNRTIFDSDGKKLTGLAGARVAELAGDYKTCYHDAEAVYKKASLIRPWVAIEILNCAIGESKDSKFGIEHLQKALANVEGHSDWFVLGPQVANLRTAYVQTHLALAEKAIRGHRSVAEKSIRRLIEIRSWLTTEHLSEVYKLSGEMAFLTQNWAQAEDFYYRSLAMHDSDDVQQRLDGLKKFLPVENSPKPKPSDEAASPSSLEVSSDEQENYQHVQSELGAGDSVSVAEDGMKIIERFPGGRRAKWVQARIIESFLTVAQKNDRQSEIFKQKMLNSMLRADGGRLFDWGSTLFQRGFYADAFALGERSYTLMHGHPDSTKILRLTSRAAYLSGNMSSAKKYFEVLDTEHAGTTEAVEAVFHLGLLHYREKQWTEAAAAFERVLALPGSGDFEYPSLYWYWRAEQKIQPQQAKIIADRLVAKFPLTFYGLRARAEQNNSSLVFPKEQRSSPIRAQIYLTEPESLSLQRLRALLEVGWFHEAQEEAKLLPQGRTAAQKILMSRYFSAAMDNVTAFQLMNQAFDLDPSLFRPDILAWAYPHEFGKLIGKEAKRNSLDDELVLALIRQESSFKLDAVSTAPAYGLMQVVLPTAKEIALDLNLKIDFSGDKQPLFDPSTNIRLGCVALARSLKNFKGHLPLALAAYNVGIGRMKKFFSARPGLETVTETSTSPDDEIWVDELPWGETSYYVKSVLRNYLMYQWLETGSLTLANPVWVKK